MKAVVESPIMQNRNESKHDHGSSENREGSTLIGCITYTARAGLWQEELRV